jgi:Flp pilus assembly protein TadG
MSRLRRGQALVEFALVTPVLATLIYGTVQFGYSFYIYNNLAKAVRDGACYASMRSYGSVTSSPLEATYATAVKNVVVYGTPNPDAGAQPVARNLTTAKVDVKMTFASGHPDTVTVAIIGYSMSLPLTTVSLDNKPSSKFQYIGRFAPS